MLLSRALLLALIATLQATTAKSLSAMDQQRQLTLIRRAQEQQQRKLLNVELKLNQVLSMLISCTHKETAGSLTNALARWESDSNRTLAEMQQNVKKLQLSLLAREEQATSLEEMHSMLALLVSKSENTRKYVEHKELEEVSVEMKAKASTITAPAAVDYFQPAKADCSELDERQRHAKGVYKFLEPDLNEMQRDFNERYCVFATAGAAWTVIQRRHQFGQESFQRGWNEYRAGFGELAGEFWFGNEYIHRLAYRDDFVLRIELEDVAGGQVWAEYELFRLDSESYSYQLEIGQPHENSSASDALGFHNGMAFRAYGSDGAYDCAGWWFDRCPEAKSNLNGASIIWGKWHNENKWITSRMLMRPRHLNSLNTDQNSTYRF